MQQKELTTRCGSRRPSTSSPSKVNSKPGLSVAVDNVGDQFHELAVGRLLDGHTVDDARAALETADEDTGDPLEGIVEENTVLGGVQAPGTAYTITASDVVAGNYVVLCFIPNSEGIPHHSLGMVTGFTVGEGEVSVVPEPEATYTISDDGLDGPSRLDASETSIEIVNDSSASREITFFKIREGNTVEDVVMFFESADEGPPDFVGGPLDFLAFLFDADSDRTITVDLTEGQWAIQTPDPGRRSTVHPPRTPARSWSPRHKPDRPPIEPPDPERVGVVERCARFSNHMAHPASTAHSEHRTHRRRHRC